MKIEEWIKIEEAFTKKYGWDKGIKIICNAQRDICSTKRIEHINIEEERKMKIRLREIYKNGSKRE